MIYNQEFYSHKINFEDYPEVKEKVEELFPEEQELTKKNIRMLIVNLLLIDEIAVPRNNNFYSKYRKGSWNSRRRGVGAQDLLKEKELIEINLGYRTPTFGTGFASQLKITEKFKEMFQNVEIREVRVDTNGMPDLAINKGNKDDRERILLKGFQALISGSIFLKNQMQAYIPNHFPDGVYGVPIPIEENMTLEGNSIEGYLISEEFQNNLKIVSKLNNEYFSKITLGFDDDEIANKKENRRMSINVYLTRIFGDTMESLGRFYQEGSSYQNIRKEDRKHLTINGKKVKEIDFSSVHLNLLYAEVKTQCPEGDLYMGIVKELIGKEDKELRKVIKLCSLILINANTFRAYTGALNQREHKEEKAILDKFGLKASDVKEAFCKIHKPIAHLLHSGRARELMKQDSDLMQDILQYLMIEEVLGIPLHDSIICQEGNEEFVAETMVEFYRMTTGLEIKVKIE